MVYNWGTYLLFAQNFITCCKNSEKSCINERRQVGNSTSIMEASSKLSCECSSENGDSSFELLLANCGTMSRMVSALTPVIFCSSSPSSLRDAQEFISRIYLFPLQVTSTFSVLFVFSMLCCREKRGKKKKHRKNKVRHRLLISILLPVVDIGIYSDFVFALNIFRGSLHKKKTKEASTFLKIRILSGWRNYVHLLKNICMPPEKPRIQAKKIPTSTLWWHTGSGDNLNI